MGLGVTPPSIRVPTPGTFTRSIFSLFLFRLLPFLFLRLINLFFLGSAASLVGAEDVRIGVKATKRKHVPIDRNNIIPGECVASLFIDVNYCSLTTVA